MQTLGIDERLSFGKVQVQSKQLSWMQKLNKVENNT